LIQPSDRGLKKITRSLLPLPMIVASPVWKLMEERFSDRASEIRAPVPSSTSTSVRKQSHFMSNERGPLRSGIAAGEFLDYERGECKATQMKIYLDNNIVSAIAKDDHPDQSIALDKLLEEAESAKVEIVTSQITRKEIENYRGQHRKVIDRIYRMIGKVTFVEDHTVVGAHSHWDRFGGESFPFVEDDPISSFLRKIRLDRTDSHHLMLAIRANCDVFLTCDEKSILRYRSLIEAQFPIKLFK
jgi:predicted nucleic acid-binding protein